MTDEPDRKFVRVTAFVMPYTAFIGGAPGAVIVVPRDDYTCSSIGVFPVPKGAGQHGGRARGPIRRSGDPSRTTAGSGCPARTARRWRPASFAGFRGGNRIQDAAVQLSSGPMYDRAKEHLVPADLAIIRLRRLLADSVRLLEAGQDPVGRGEGCDFARITAASQIIDASQAWQDLVPAHQGSAS